MPKVQIQLFNDTLFPADIQVSHQFGARNVDKHVVYRVPAGTSDSPFMVETDPTSNMLDRWFFHVRVRDNPARIYQSPRGTLNKPGSPCKLGEQDAFVPIHVAEDRCVIRRSSGSVDVPMTPQGSQNPVAGAPPGVVNYVTNVFVLMLENRSFDHLFGRCQPKGYTVAGAETQAETLPPNSANTFKGDGDNPRKYVCEGRPFSQMQLTVDPGHDFLDVMEQMCGKNFLAEQTFGTEKNWYDNNPLRKDPPEGYPTIDMSGFAANYARQFAEPWRAPLASRPYKPEENDKIREVMTGVAASENLTLRQLARHYALCDHWHSSMPGPTWPNRFFAVAGTSGGLDDSPSKYDVAESMLVRGLTYKFDNGTLFDRLDGAKLSWRIYMDKANQFVPAGPPPHYLGKWAIARGMKGVSIDQVREFRDLSSALNDTYDAQFTWIEPNYGDIRGKSYASGSSQHPIDDLDAGERLIAETYRAIRNSPLWETSLLIITYDEHGGLYDHVAPPPAVAPGDHANYSTRGFGFNRLGARVPAVVVSPLIPRRNGRTGNDVTSPGSFNVIDSTTRDHTCIIKTVTELNGLDNLTARDANMTSVLSLLTSPTVRPDEDCPIELNLDHLEHGAADRAERIARDVADRPARDADPLPDSGNLVASLYECIDTDVELSDRTEAALQAIEERVNLIKTVGDADQYASEVWAKVEADDQVREAFEGALSDDDLDNLASQMGLDGKVFRGLMADIAGKVLANMLDAANVSADRSDAIAAWVQELEADQLPTFDAEDRMLVVPRGATAIMRAALSRLPPRIESVSPAEQVAAGIGQMLTIRGRNLPSVLVVSQNGREYSAAEFFFKSFSYFAVRLDPNLRPGPATIRLTDVNRALATPDFSIVISATPGTPVITAVGSAPNDYLVAPIAPGGKVTPGEKIAIEAEGIDTSGAVIEWTNPVHGTLTSPSELTYRHGAAPPIGVITTVPNVTLNDTWTLNLRVGVWALSDDPGAPQQLKLSAPCLYPLQT